MIPPPCTHVIAEPSRAYEGLLPEPSRCGLPPPSRATNTSPPASNATEPQLPSIDAFCAGAPMPREMSTVRPRWKLRTKTSETGSVSPSARLVEVDWKATQRGRLCMEPSSDGFQESPLPCASLDETLARTS